MLVLALDTATPTVTAGVVRLLGPSEVVASLEADGGAAEPIEALAERTVTDAFGHAEHLMPLVTDALDIAGYGLGDIDAVVTGLGPGPFTGLRVGIATAASLGDALGIPAHGVPSHDAVARQAAVSGEMIVVSDARRREVYFSAYGPDGRRLHGPAVAAPQALPALLERLGLHPTAVAGAGAALVRGILEVPVARADRPLGSELVRCAARELLTGVVPPPLSPLYLRRPDAAEPSGPKAVLPKGTSHVARG